MAELPFVDTHLHFWDFARPELRYAWLEGSDDHPLLGNIEAIKMPLYGADEFIAETRFHNVHKSVHVQAAIGIEDPVDETRWLQQLADSTGVPDGIVAHTSLAGDDAAEVLERHLAFPSMRGVRDYGDGDYLVDERWRRGYALLAKNDLVCCLDLQWQDMEKALDLARAYPNVVLCANHAGFPTRRDEEYHADWRRAMGALAQADNVVVKISGLGMFDRCWTVESLRPWVLGSIEAFGVERTFFGTNWPVDRLYSSYGDVLDAYAALIADFSLDEQRAMFSGNAERIFRI
jgi:predicted TIM-barrel fold metal-dependent hydrolase